MKNICIVLDPAHGKEVPGKRSPDNSHREYLWSRERCRNLAIALRSLGYEVFFTNSTEYEIGLSKRQRNALSVKTDKQKFLLSLHNDAVGSGTSWNNARGWSVWTTKGVTKSDECASIIFDQLLEDFPGYKFRQYSVQKLDRDFESNFTVLMGSGYMAVLVEWLFQDNKYDVAELSKPEVNARFERSIIEAIEKINNHFSR